MTPSAPLPTPPAPAHTPNEPVMPASMRGANLVVDDCPDSRGNCTLRHADGTPNGDTETCVATVYGEVDAYDIVSRWNAYPTLRAERDALRAACEVAVAFVPCNFRVPANPATHGTTCPRCLMDRALSLSGRGGDAKMGGKRDQA